MTDRVVVVGLGPIGASIARALGPRLCGAVEIRADAPDVGAPVWPSLADARERADVAVIATGSRLPSVAPTVSEALDAGLHVVSTCEELAWPWLRHAAIARDLDARARAAGRAVLGTGVNPGFVMDRLALTAARACARVASIAVERVVDAVSRREQLVRKVGAGLSEAEWRAGAAAGRIGHVGLGESAAIVATGLGWDPGDVQETLDPQVEAGTIRGVRQKASAAGGRVRLRLLIAVGAPDPHDRVHVEGDPPIELVVRAGVQGDRGTVGATLDAVARVAALRPGLRTVLDLPLL